MPKTIRQGKKEVALPKAFNVKLLAGADGRTSIIKELRRRVARLKNDTGVQSYQKEILAERAIFMLARIESLEAELAESGKFNEGSYVCLVNSMIGILKSLGLDKARDANEVDLQTFLAEKKGRS